MTTKRLLISVTAVLVLSGLGYWGYLQFLAPVNENDVDLPTSETTAIETSTSVTAEGRIVPLAQAQLAFEGGGVVTSVAVSAGDVVEKGATLLLLDSAEQEIALRQAQAALAQAEANLWMAEVGVQLAETAASAAEVNVLAAEANYALLAADPTAAQVALNQHLVDAAAANVSLSVGNQAVVLEGNGAAQIQAAEAAVAAAQAAYTATRQTYEPIAQDENANESDRQLAQTQLNAAAANLEAAQTRLAELQAGASGAELAAAAGGVQAAQNEQLAAEAELALLQAGAQAEQLAIAQAEITLAQEHLAEVQLQVQQAETAVSQAEAAVAEAAVQVNLAQLALEKRALLASFSGTIAETFVKVGEVVSAGQPVVIVADFSAWQVETTDLVEADVVALAPGFAGTVAIDAFAERPLVGRIMEIGEVAAEVRGDVTYVITIALPSDSGGLPLRWGMSAFITIERNQ